MSKVKDELQRIQEIEFEQYVSFMEWVCDQKQEVSESNTNEVEEDSKESSTAGTSIVHQKALKAVNNVNYNPKIGA